MRNWTPEDILYEDSEILVCHKYAGMAVQSRRVGQMDMESAIKNYLKGGFVGIIQRLDQPVGGILVFGKTREATASLNRQQQQGKFEKKYLALFSGSLPAKEGKLEDYLLKDGKTNTSKVVKAGTDGAKRAVLYYKLLDTFHGVSMAEITLETGRHHQIRVQMAYHGMPLWGDGKYNSQIEKKERGDGIGLCAYQLSFLHPKSGKKMKFELEENKFAQMVLSAN